MKVIAAVIGWIVGVQGALGVAGRVFSDEPWGVMRHWWDVPTGAYAALALLGGVLALWGETGHRKRA